MERSLVHQRPRGAGVVARKRPPLSFSTSAYTRFGVGGRDRHADAPHQPLGRQPGVARDLRPRLAAVGALEQPAPRTAARHLVFLAVRLPHRRVHHVRVLAVDRDVDRAGLVVAEEHLAPRLAAVGALEHAALVARHAVLAERRRRRRCRGLVGWMRIFEMRIHGRGSPRASRSCRRRRCGTRRHPA